MEGTRTGRTVTVVSEPIIVHTGREGQSEAQAFLSRELDITPVTKCRDRPRPTRTGGGPGDRRTARRYEVFDATEPQAVVRDPSRT
jgi:hypothetical protein